MTAEKFNLFCPLDHIFDCLHNYLMGLPDLKKLSFWEPLTAGILNETLCKYCNKSQNENISWL